MTWTRRLCALRRGAVCLLLVASAATVARAQLTVNVPAGGDVLGAAAQVYAAGGGTINLAAGTYNITNSIVLGSNTTLNGAGGPGSATQSVIYAPASPNGIAMITGPAGLQNMTISNLVLDGNIPQSAMLYGTGNGNYAYNDTGIYVYSQSTTTVGMNLINIEVRHTLRGILTGLVDNLTISGCYFHDNNPGGFSHNMYLVATSGVEIDHTRSNNALTGDGLHIDFGGYFYTIRKSEFSGNNGLGLLSQEDNDVTIEDSKLDMNTDDGLQIDAGGLVLTRDEMNDNGNYGFEIPDTADGNGLVNGVYTVANNSTDYFYQANIVDFTLSNPGPNTYAAVQANGVIGVTDTADWTLNYGGYTYEGAVDFNANHLTNGSITFPTVGATIEGVPGSGVGFYALNLRYSNGSSGTQTMNVSVNGGAPVTVNFPPTGSYSTWATVTMVEQLNVGNNTVTVSVPAGATSAPELDTLTVTTPTPAVPNAPTNLTATSNGPYSVTLNWTAPANTNQNAAQTYIVYKNNTLPVVARNVVGTTWTDTRIFYGETTNSYFVTAVNQGGQSSQSNTATVTTGIDAPPGLQVTVVPSAPANNLNWLGVSGAASYLVERSTVSGGPYQTIGTVAANTGFPAYSDNLGTCTSPYFYVVAAVDANNVVSANSYQVATQCQTFTLAASAATVNLSSAATVTDAVSVVGTNGFSDAVTFAVNGLPAGVTAALSPGSGSGTQITFTATSSAALGSYPLTITGTDGNISSSVGVTLNVGLAQTITFNAVPPQAVGNTLMPMASASSGLPITFTVVPNGNCSVTNNAVTFLQGGACGIIANQAGNATYGAAAPVGQVVQVGAPVAQTITFAPIPTQAIGAMVPLTASASSGLPVSFASSTQGVCQISGSTASLIMGGTCTIVASQAGGGTYGPAPSVSQSFSVVNGGQTQTITFTAPSLVTYGVAPIALNGTASSGLPVSYSLLSGPGSLSGSTLRVTGAGTIVVAANQAGNNIYNAATQMTVNIQVSPAPVTITVNSASAVYGAGLPALSGTVGATQNGDVLSPSYSTTATAGSGVGQYPISATLSGATAMNYTATVTPGTLTITAATLTATANNQSRAYGAANPTLTYGVAGYVNGDTSSVLSGAAAVSTTATATSGVGSYPITIAQGTLSAGNNYVFAFVNGALQVTAVNTTTTVSAGPVSAVYGQQVVLSAKVVDANNNPVTGGSVSYSLYNAATNTATTFGTATVNATTGVASYTTTTLPAGSQTVIAVYGAQLNYGASGGSTGVTISKAPLTVTVNAATSVYGSALPALSGTVTGTQNNDPLTVTYSTTATAGSGVGPYPITATLSGAQAANYTATVTPATLTVTPATLTVTANSVSRPYGTANPTLTYAATGFVNGDTSAILTGAPTLATTATASSAMGPYPITITQGTLSAGNNYGFLFVNGTLQVTAAGGSSTSIAALPTSSTYGQMVTLTATVTSSGVAVTSGTVSFTGAGVNLGSANVNATTGVASVQTTLLPGGMDAVSATYTSATYGNSLGTGSINVAPAPVTITVNSATMVYGAALPGLSGTSGATQNGDVLAISYSTTGGATSGVGQYPITATLTGASATNYTATVTPGVLTVTPATLTATATSLTRNFGAANPTLTYTVAGYVNGDTSAILSGTPALSTTATASSPVATYPITIAQGTLSAGNNYSFVFVGGSLQVTAGASQTVISTLPANPVYGQPVTVTATVTSNGTPLTSGSVSFSGGGLNLGSASVDPATGTAHVQTTLLPGGTDALSAVFSSNTFPGSSGSGSVTVAPAAVTITVNAASKVYGAALPALSGSSGTTQNGDVLGIAYATTATAASGVGNYPITAMLTGVSATNYTATVTPALLTVTPATLTAAANSVSRSFGTANPALTYAVSGFVNGDTSAILSGAPVLATTATTTSPVSTYPITIAQGTLSAGNNYGFVLVNGTLQVTVATGQTITFAPISNPTYGGAPFTVAATASSGLPVTISLVAGTSVTLSGATATLIDGTVTPVAAGAATLEASQAGNGNYPAAATVMQSFAVQPAVLTATANNASYVYGTTPAALTGSLSAAVGSDSFSESFTTNAPATVPVPAGMYTITPVVAAQGNTKAANYSVVTTTGTLTVSQAGTATTLQSSTGAINLGVPVQFTATVSSLTTGTPTLTVSFVDNGVTIGSMNLSGGTASFTTTGLGAGPHSVVAKYGGDGNFTQSSSAPVSVTVTAPGFSVTSSAPTLSVQDGSSATLGITVSTVGGYAKTVTASCGSGLPNGLTCSFAPPSLTFTGLNNSQSTTLTVTALRAALSPPVLQSGARTELAMLWLPGGLVGLLGLAGLRRRRPRAWQRLAMLALLLLAGAGAIAGCGSSPAQQQVVPGTYSVPVTVSDGTSSAAVTISVTVTQ